MARNSKGAKPSEIRNDRREQALLVAAYELIAQKGFEGLRTRDIAARAGVNISTLHYYFGTKEALVEAVVRFVAAKFAGEGQLAARASAPTLRQHFETALSTFQKNPRLAIVLQELAIRSQRDATTRAAFRPILKFWNLQLEGVIEAGKRAGSLPAHLQGKETALIVTSFIMGAMTQAGVNPKALDFSSLSRELERLITAQPGQ